MVRMEGREREEFYLFLCFVFSRPRKHARSLRSFSKKKHQIKNPIKQTEDVTDDDEEGGAAPPSKRAKRGSAAEEEEEEEEEEVS